MRNYPLIPVSLEDLLEFVVKEYTDEHRMELIRFLSHLFCLHCGGLELPCYCKADD